MEIIILFIMWIILVAIRPEVANTRVVGWRAGGRGRRGYRGRR
jgi:hypothetical protein